MNNEKKRKKLSLGDIIRKMNEGPVSGNIGTDRDIKSNAVKQPPANTDYTSSDVADKRNPTRPGSPSKETNPQAPPLSRPKLSIPSPALDNRSTIPQSSHQETSHPQNGYTAPLTSPDIDEEEEFDIFRYLHIVMRRKEIVILSIIVMGLFSGFSFLRSTKYYTASARLLFRPNQGDIISSNKGWRYFGDRQKNFNTHLELLKSNIVLERVVTNLEDRVKSDEISSGLKIRRGETDGEANNIIELTFSHTNAENSRDILNELCKTYIDYRREVNAQEETRLTLKLEIQINKIQNDLTTKEDALRNFKENHSMVHLSKDVNLIITKLANMEIALQETQLTLLENRERLTSLKSHISQQEINTVQSMTYENPVRKKLSELELELNTLSGEYSKDHFKIKQITKQIENLKAATQSEIQKELTDKAVSHTLIKNPIRQSLLETYVNHNIEISTLEVKRTAQEQIIEKLNGQMTKLPSLEQEYAFLQRETESLLKTIQMLKMKLEETKIRRDSKESELKILELAKTPTTAISSKKKSSILIGILIGLIIGIALTFLLEYLDQTIKEPSEIEKYLETPLLGIVPLIEAENAIVDNKELAKSVLEPFRALRTNIKHIAIQNHAKLFMICSAVKGEGKTTLAINLAITFAMDGKKVLLIDCDLRRSQIHTLLNISKITGLTDYLLGTKSIDEIIKSTTHDNLSVITSGERPSNPAELLGTPMFNKLLSDGKSYADIILIDSPALIPVSDSISMAPYMDGCIIVTRALWTPLKAAKQAKNQLSRIGANIIGGILNGITHSRGYYPYYYGYYGYYAYKYSYDYDEKPKRRFSIREFGITVESRAKAFFQHLRTSLPRYLIAIGGLFKYLTKKISFWFLTLLLISVIAIRYFFYPASIKKSDNELITYLGTGEKVDIPGNSPIVVLGSGTDKHPLSNNADVNRNTSFSSLTQETGFAYQESLSVWKEAYNSADTSRLFNLYSRSTFSYPGGDFKNWNSRIVSELFRKSNRNTIISINGISSYKVKKEHIKTSFMLTVVKNRDTTNVKKYIIWKKINNHWYIIMEKSKTSF